MYIHHVTTIALVGTSCRARVLVSALPRRSSLLCCPVLCSQLVHPHLRSAVPSRSTPLHTAHSFACAGFSFLWNYLRVGALVLYVHDMSDVPIDVLKMVNLLSLESAHGFFISEIVFVLNLISWAYFRLYTFLATVIHCAYIEGHRHLGTYMPGKPWLQPFDNGIDMHLFFNVLLMTLWCLHVWWFYLLVRIAFKLLTKPAHAVGREEYEGASESEPEHDDADKSKKD